MAKQTGQNVLVAYKVEGTYNTAPGDSSGYRLRLNSSPGLSMSRPTIQPGEVRADMLTPIGRLGSRSVGGSYNCDLSVGSFDVILEALMRSTWVAANAITESDITSITTTTSTVIAAAGSWITEGVRVGDIVRITEHATAANNDLNLMVSTVSATTITVHGTPLTANAVADTNITVTILKKLTNGATPTRRTFYVEEYNQDIDQSEVFGGCVWNGFTLTGSPDGMATLDLPVVGGSVTDLATGASPYYSSPTLGANPGLVFVDAAIKLGGSAIASATAFSLSLDLGAATLPVIGATVSPDTFDGMAVLSGSISLLREDLTRLAAFEAETEYELHILLEESSGTPLKALSFFLPKIKFTGVDAALGGDGGMVETIPFMAGVLTAVTGYDGTLMSVCTET